MVLAHLQMQHTQLTKWQKGTATVQARKASCRILLNAKLRQVEDAPKEKDDASNLHNQIQLFNTMTRKKEVFHPRPLSPGEVKMYVCGVTVYDYSHIGHARVYTCFDTLYRLLMHVGYSVQYVRNFTDVDDKIIARARERGEEPSQLTERFIEEFYKDMDALGCLRPSLEPRATHYIPEMITSIERIIQNGHAYVLEGDVYFDVASLPNYGRLSGRGADDNRAGERVDIDGRKRSAADFALWKSAKPGEPFWPSPWGPGRPGWHIECSSMIHTLMGDTIDIHGGGLDLIFPHHENELAQSLAAAGPSGHEGCGCNGHAAAAAVAGSNGEGAAQQFVRYWVHNGFVNVDSEKMSKSLGNFFTIRDVLTLYAPETLRWFLASAHYRSPLNYSSASLEEVGGRAYYVYQTLADLAEALATSPGELPSPSPAKASLSAAAGVQDAVVAALLDDLNTPVALSALSAPLKAVNDLLGTKAGKKVPNRMQLLADYQRELLGALSLLGLAPSDLSQTLEGMRARALKRAGLVEEDVVAAIQSRAEARKMKDFARSDEIRDQLQQKGILIMDTPQGTTWRPAVLAS